MKEDNFSSNGMQSCTLDNSNYFEQWVIYSCEQASTLLPSFICFIPHSIQQINNITSKETFSTVIICASRKRILISLSLWTNPFTVRHSSLFSFFIINSTHFCVVTRALKKRILIGLVWHGFRFLKF